MSLAEREPDSTPPRHQPGKHCTRVFCIYYGTETAGNNHIRNPRNSCLFVLSTLSLRRVHLRDWSAGALIIITCCQSRPSAPPHWRVWPPQATAVITVKPRPPLCSPPTLSTSILGSLLSVQRIDCSQRLFTPVRSEPNKLF